MMKVLKAQQKGLRDLCQLHICLAVVIKERKGLHLLWHVTGITYFVMVESSGSRIIFKTELNLIYFPLPPQTTLIKVQKPFFPSPE